MHPVGCHFGAAVRERTAAATGRRRLARQVHLLRGLRPDAGLVSALQDAVAADHGKSGRTEMGAEGAEVRPITLRETLGAASAISNKRTTSKPRHSHSFSDAPGRRQGYQTLGACRYETLGGVSSPPHLNAIKGKIFFGGGDLAVRSSEEQERQHSLQLPLKQGITQNFPLFIYIMIINYMFMLPEYCSADILGGHILATQNNNEQLYHYYVNIIKLHACKGFSDFKVPTLYPLSDLISHLIRTRIT